MNVAGHPARAAHQIVLGGVGGERSALDLAPSGEGEARQPARVEPLNQGVEARFGKLLGRAEIGGVGIGRQGGEDTAGRRGYRNERNRDAERLGDRQHPRAQVGDFLERSRAHQHGEVAEGDQLVKELQRSQPRVGDVDVVEISDPARAVLEWEPLERGIDDQRRDGGLGERAPVCEDIGADGAEGEDDVGVPVREQSIDHGGGPAGRPVRRHSQAFREIDDLVAAEVGDDLRFEGAADAVGEGGSAVEDDPDVRGLSARLLGSSQRDDDTADDYYMRPTGPTQAMPPDQSNCRRCQEARRD